MLCSPSTSGALRLTPFGFAQDRLRTTGLPFVLSVAKRSRSRDAAHVRHDENGTAGLQSNVKRSNVDERKSHLYTF